MRKTARLALRNRGRRSLPWILVFLCGCLMLPSPAWAFIPHWDPREAFFVRQFSYLFWALAMVFFVIALRQENLRQHRGFRWLVWAGVLFALWNFDCFIGQFAALAISPQGIATFTAGETQGGPVSGLWLWVFYLTKPDHLLLVPAFLCFYLGIRAFTNDPEVKPE
jgi:hypothetical protein